VDRQLTYHGPAVPGQGPKLVVPLRHTQRFVTDTSALSALTGPAVPRSGPTYPGDVEIRHPSEVARGLGLGYDESRALELAVREWVAAPDPISFRKSVYQGLRALAPTDFLLRSEIARRVQDLWKATRASAMPDRRYERITLQKAVGGKQMSLEDLFATPKAPERAPGEEAPRVGTAISRPAEPKRVPTRAERAGLPTGEEHARLMARAVSRGEGSQLEAIAPEEHQYVEDEAKFHEAEAQRASGRAAELHQAAAKAFRAGNFLAAHRSARMALEEGSKAARQTEERGVSPEAEAGRQRVVAEQTRSEEARQAAHTPPAKPSKAEWKPGDPELKGAALRAWQEEQARQANLGAGLGTEPPPGGWKPEDFPPPAAMHAMNERARASAREQARIAEEKRTRESTPEAQQRKLDNAFLTMRHGALAPATRKKLLAEMEASRSQIREAEAPKPKSPAPVATSAESGAAKKPAPWKAPKQAVSLKPPAGFTPIPNSKHGGYHKRVGNHFVYWYPGVGEVQNALGEDAKHAQAHHEEQQRAAQAAEVKHGEAPGGSAAHGGEHLPRLVVPVGGGARGAEAAPRGAAGAEGPAGAPAGAPEPGEPKVEPKSPAERQADIASAAEVIPSPFDDRLNLDPPGKPEPEVSKTIAAEYLPDVETVVPEDVKRFPYPTGEIKQLFKHQVDAAARIVDAWKHRDGYILQSDAGLGKTNSALAAVVTATKLQGGTRHLIVVPTMNKEGLLLQWGGETAAGLYGLKLRGLKARTEGKGEEKKTVVGEGLSATEPGYYVVSYDELTEILKDADGKPVKEPGPFSARTGKPTKAVPKRINCPELFNGLWDTITFDESHTMVGKDGKGGIGAEAAKQLAERAGKVLYMSATPFTNITDMHYLTRLGNPKDPDRGSRMFGNNPDEFAEWAEYVGAVKTKAGGLKNPPSWIPKVKLAAMMHVYGMTLKQQAMLTGLHSKFHQLDRKALSPEQHRVFDLADKIFDLGAGGLGESIMGMWKTAWTKAYWETLKIPEAIRMAKEALAEGKQVAVFTSYKAFNHAHLRKIPEKLHEIADKMDERKGPGAGNEIRMLAMEAAGYVAQLPQATNTVEQLTEALGGGSVVAEIHGATSKKPADEQRAYQKGHKKVCVATMARGGTGISLHDTTGERPRVQINLSLPWSGRQFDQVAGRSHRLGSKSETVMHWLLGDDDIERRNAKIVATRLRNQNAYCTGDPAVNVHAGMMAAFEHSNVASDDDDEGGDIKSLSELTDQLMEDEDEQVLDNEKLVDIRDAFNAYAEQIKGGRNLLAEAYEASQEQKRKEALLEHGRAAEQIRVAKVWHVEPLTTKDGSEGYWIPYDRIKLPEDHPHQVEAGYTYSKEFKSATSEKHMVPHGARPMNRYVKGLYDREYRKRGYWVPKDAIIKVAESLGVRNVKVDMREVAKRAKAAEERAKKEAEEKATREKSEREAYIREHPKAHAALEALRTKMGDRVKLVPYYPEASGQKVYNLVEQRPEEGNALTWQMKPELEAQGFYSRDLPAHGGWGVLVKEGQLEDLTKLLVEGKGAGAAAPPATGGGLRGKRGSGTYRGETVAVEYVGPTRISAGRNKAKIRFANGSETWVDASDVTLHKSLTIPSDPLDVSLMRIRSTLRAREAAMGPELVWVTEEQLGPLRPETPIGWMGFEAEVPGTLLMEKARSHKYIKRVPTGNPQRPWRYFYKLPSGEIVSSGDVVTGARFKASHLGHVGHFHVLNDDVDRGLVHVQHDESGRQAHIRTQDLQRMVQGYHQKEAERKLTAAEDAKLPAPELPAATMDALGRGGYDTIEGFHPDVRELYRLAARMKKPDREFATIRQPTGFVLASRRKGTGTVAPKPSAAAAPAKPKASAKDRETRFLMRSTGPKRIQAMPARYELVEADSLIASHDPQTFAERSEYPPGVQERRYHEVESDRTKIDEIARNLEPELMVNTTPSAIDGAPIVSENGIVLGGNGRTMGMQRAYQTYPEQAATLRSYLERHARTFGYDAAEVSKMRNPILIRRIEAGTDPKHLASLGRRMNESLTQGMDPRTAEVALGKNYVTPELLDTLTSEMNPDESLAAFFASCKSRDFVKALERSGIIDQFNRAEFVDDEGMLNEDGRNRVERVLAARFLPDARLLSQMNQKARTAIAKSIPYLAQAEAAGWDIREPLKLAVQADVEMRRDKLFKRGDEAKSRNMWMSSPTLTGDATVDRVRNDPAAIALLEVIQDHAGSTKMARGFKQVALEADRQKHDHGDQGSMFARPKVELHESIAEAFGLKGTGTTYAALSSEAIAARKKKGAKLAASLGAPDWIKAQVGDEGLGRYLMHAITWEARNLVRGAALSSPREGLDGTRLLERLKAFVRDQMENDRDFARAMGAHPVNDTMLRGLLEAVARAHVTALAKSLSRHELHDRWTHAFRRNPGRNPDAIMEPSAQIC